MRSDLVVGSSSILEVVVVASWQHLPKVAMVVKVHIVACCYKDDWKVVDWY